MPAPSPYTLAADLLDPPADPFQDAHSRPDVFIDEHCWVIPAEGGAPIRFHLWECQRDALADFQAHANVVVLKARQLGLSWLALAYGLWLTNCRDFQTCLILNRNLGAAIELLDRIRFMHSRLPDGLRTPIEQDTNDPKMPMVVLANGSRIISLPSTEDTGSGLTGQLIIADEVAKWRWATETFTAILPILSGGDTTLLAISTMKGLHSYFARLWMNALPGAADPNGYWPVFIPSSAHPDRDEAWLAAEARKYPDVRRFKREHPETWQEAFQLSDDAVFSEFDRGRHHVPFRREPQWPVWRGIDFGFHFSPCVWIEVQADRVAHVCGELDQRESTTQELAAEIVACDIQYGLESSQMPAGVDPAGKARTSQSGTDTDHATLRAAGISDLRTIEPSVPSDRVDLIKRLLRDGRLVIDCDRCPRTAEALEQAQWRTRRSPDGERVRTETYAEDGFLEHYLDALGYALANIWPSLDTPAAAAGPSPVRHRSTRYGQSEFD